MKSKKAKIICTIGPACDSEEMLTKLTEAGMNIARLNFSHGDHDTHLKNIESMRRLSKELDKPVAILQDLQGPKIRVGKLIDDQMELEDGVPSGTVFITRGGPETHIF